MHISVSSGGCSRCPLTMCASSPLLALCYSQAIAGAALMCTSAPSLFESPQVTSPHTLASVGDPPAQALPAASSIVHLALQPSSSSVFPSCSTGSTSAGGLHRHTLHCSLYQRASHSRRIPHLQTSGRPLHTTQIMHMHTQELTLKVTMQCSRLDGCCVPQIGAHVSASFASEVQVQPVSTAQPCSDGVSSSRRFDGSGPCRSLCRRFCFRRCPRHHPDRHHSVRGRKTDSNRNAPWWVSSCGAESKFETQV